MQQYRKYLTNVQGKLTTPQASALYEDIKDRHTGNVIDAVNDVLNEGHGMDKKKMYEYGGDMKKKKMYEYGGDMKKKKMYEYGKDKKKMMNESEQIVMEYLEGFFGDDLNENTTDEQIMEAIHSLNLVCESVNEYVMNEHDDSDPNEIVVEYFNSYFDGGLNEDTSEEDIENSIDYINDLTSIVNEYFSAE